MNPKKKKPGTTEYILREIDEELWKKVKSKAALEGVTVKEVMLKLLEGYVAHEKLSGRDLS